MGKGWVRPITSPEVCNRFLERLTGGVRFALVVGSTDTAQIEGISAAGATPEMRRYTAALDAEYLLFGKTISMADVPRNPLGPPSPVLISRAALNALGATPLIIDAGSRVPPATPRLDLGCRPGASIVTGRALELPENFNETCRAAARMLFRPGEIAVLAESVPGGTTTALSLLTALGVDARGKVSSSMGGGNHTQKEEVVLSALKAANLPPRPTAFEAVRAVGDPMQPVVALMALEASLTGPVVLGGGTQMAAVWALIHRFIEEGEAGNSENIALATTKWVSEDLSADLSGILNQMNTPLAAFTAMLDFSACRSHGLRRYEEGLVKEGVGAGAAAFAALIGGEATLPELTAMIDDLALQIG